MLPLETIVLRLAWAGLLGAVVGVERLVRRRPAGMRTGFCVCLAAAFFTIVSTELAQSTGDSGTTRIASNIVQGIGFLGAGAILRERGGVTGLTTAATIFVTAALGMAAGAGMYRASGFACLLVLFALVVFMYIEEALNLHRRYMLFRITTDQAAGALAEISTVLSGLKVRMENLQVSPADGKNLIQFDADVSHHQQAKIAAVLTKSGATYQMMPVERQAE
jgi:putative Mg2+ transporter-C (MgtC) family protein